MMEQTDSLGLIAEVRETLGELSARIVEALSLLELAREQKDRDDALLLVDTAAEILRG